MATWDEFCDFVRETALLQSTKELLEWDERTVMPERAGAYRAEQITLLSSWIHRRRTDTRLADWLAELADHPQATDRHSDVGTTLRQIRRDFDRQTKIPPKLVEELARATILGQQAWVRARKESDFQLFQPHLQQIVELKQQEAQALGYENTPYDALLDEYEPDARTSDVASVLSSVANALVPLIQAIGEADQRAPREILTREYSEQQQRRLGTEIAANIGFDFARGRLDVTHHPFCAAMGPHDCRITTRYDEHFFSSAFFGILHEAGHGLYEQGLRTEQYGLPPGTYASLGIHESQSRLWENFVGRSQAFWTTVFPVAQQVFPDALRDVTPQDFYFAVNDVRPSLIRVEADEATYNLHIVIRFELEQLLLQGDLKVADLPTAWKEQYGRYLGIEPADHAEGVLQDIHWAAGLFGYFPTYSLGNLYAAQFFQQAQDDLGDLDEQLARGEFTPLREWLHVHVHQSGQCYSAAGLVEKVTGRPLTHQPLMDHLYRKLGPLYGVVG